MRAFGPLLDEAPFATSRRGGSDGVVLRDVAPNFYPA
jgi:hypothetical protein